MKRAAGRVGKSGATDGHAIDGRYPAAVLLAGFLWLAAAPGAAGEADVLKADVRCDGATCSFSVAVQHADEGWSHYADKWEVLGPGGELLAVRELAHPHVTEQPFTRSLGNVEIPAGVGEVTIRAHDSVHGYGGEELTVRIPR